MRIPEERMVRSGRTEPAGYKQRELILLGERRKQQQLCRAKLPHRPTDQPTHTCGAVTTKERNHTHPQRATPVADAIFNVNST